LSKSWIPPLALIETTKKMAPNAERGDGQAICFKDFFVFVGPVERSET
jgi:hypothetical protein